MHHYVGRWHGARVDVQWHHKLPSTTSTNVFVGPPWAWDGCSPKSIGSFLLRVAAKINVRIGVKGKDGVVSIAPIEWAGHQVEVSLFILLRCACLRINLHLLSPILLHETSQIIRLLMLHRSIKTTVLRDDSKTINRLSEHIKCILCRSSICGESSFLCFPVEHFS